MVCDIYQKDKPRDFSPTHTLQPVGGKYGQISSTTFLLVSNSGIFQIWGEHCLNWEKSNSVSVKGIIHQVGSEVWSRVPWITMFRPVYVGKLLYAPFFFPNYTLWLGQLSNKESLVQPLCITNRKPIICLVNSLCRKPQEAQRDETKICVTVEPWHNSSARTRAVRYRPWS